MRPYRDYLLPWMTDRLMRTRTFRVLRERLVSRAYGRVLEIGFGSGLNLPHYGPRLRELLAVDPATYARRLARERIARFGRPIHFPSLRAEALDVETRSIDCVVTTWTLCSIPDLPRALSELRRVLRPGGEIFFLEHGLAESPRTQRWQRRLDPVQRCIAGGCHLSRPIDVELQRAGCEILELERYALPGPKLLTSMYEGVARP
jgi:ubiquinone/menaquinone biosynthesis C-methylase UbiE